MGLYGEGYKDIFGTWELLKVKDYKVEVEVKYPERFWEIRSAMAELIDDAEDRELRGPAGDKVRIGVERTTEEKARFKWLAALEKVLRDALQKMSQKMR